MSIGVNLHKFFTERTSCKRREQPNYNRGQNSYSKTKSDDRGTRNGSSPRNKLEQNTLECICFNARSLLPKMDSFRCTVEIFKPDVIGITESWTTDEISNEELNITGYDLYRQDRNGNHKGGGVLLYVNSSLQSTAYTPASEFPEHVWCKLHLSSGQELHIGVCYRTPTPGIFNVDLDNSLRQLVNDVSQKRLLLMGDFNYSNINWSQPYHTHTAEVSKLFVECLDDCFLTQHVREPTRITKTSKAILDLVITDQPDMIDGVEILDNQGDSDHQMLRWKTVIGVEHHECQVKVKDYNRADYESIRVRLRQVDWDRALLGDTNQCWTEFKKIL